MYTKPEERDIIESISIGLSLAAGAEGDIDARIEIDEAKNKQYGDVKIINTLSNTVLVHFIFHGDPYKLSGNNGAPFGAGHERRTARQLSRDEEWAKKNKASKALLDSVDVGAYYDRGGSVSVRELTRRLLTDFHRATTGRGVSAAAWIDDERNGYPASHPVINFLRDTLRKAEKEGSILRVVDDFGTALAKALQLGLYEKSNMSKAAVNSTIMNIAFQGAAGAVQLVAAVGGLNLTSGLTGRSLSAITYVLKDVGQFAEIASTVKDSTSPQSVSKEAVNEMVKWVHDNQQKNETALEALQRGAADALVQTSPTAWAKSYGTYGQIGAGVRALEDLTRALYHLAKFLEIRSHPDKLQYLHQKYKPLGDIRTEGRDLYRTSHGATLSQTVGLEPTGGRADLHIRSNADVEPRTDDLGDELTALIRFYDLELRKDNGKLESVQSVFDEYLDILGSATAYVNGTNLTPVSESKEYTNVRQGLQKIRTYRSAVRSHESTMINNLRERKTALRRPPIHTDFGVARTHDETNGANEAIQTIRRLDSYCQELAISVKDFQDAHAAADNDIDAIGGVLDDVNDNIGALKRMMTMMGGAEADI